MERQAKDGTIFKQVGQDEWEPVTRTAKDGTVYKKMGADEWAPLESRASESDSNDQRSFLEKTRDSLDVTNWPKNMMAGLQKVDEYTGAPIRKFITESVTGEELEKAPTGAEQAKRLGVTDVTYGEKFGLPGYLGGNISPADVAGVGLEVLQDPFTLGAAAVKGVQGLARAGAPLAERAFGRQAVRATQNQAAQATAESAAKSSASISGGGSTLEQGGQLFSVKAPQSLDELRQWKPQGNSGALPGKQRLAQIESVVPDLQVKPLKIHYDMMDNPKAMKELKLRFENLPTEDAKKIAAYNQGIIDESVNKIAQTVGEFSGSAPRSLTDAGYDLISSVKNKYQSEKEMLGPVFQQIQQNADSMGQVASRDLAIALGENTKVGKLLAQDEATGRLMLKKNSPRTGLSDSEHGILARVIDDLNDGMTFKELQDTREFLRKAIDPTNPGASAEIGKVRSVMLGQLEELASRQGASVGETFKAYAKNERARESFEKIIGGSVDSLDAMFAANPDKVLQKIFSNPNYAKIVGEYVGPQKMNEMVGAYIQSGIAKATDSATGFAPHKFKSWLKTNEKFLSANMPAEIVERLSALADYGYYGKRFLDEVNPSGTAASLIEALQPGNFFQRLKNDGVVGTVMSETAGRVGSAVKQRQSMRAINEGLGTSPKPRREFNVPIPDISGGLEKLKQAQSASASARGLIQDSRSLKSAEEKPTKGPEKWVNDGIENLNRAGIPLETLEALRSDPKGRKLLIEAQGAKPNSTRMKSVIQKIRTASAGGNN